MSDEMIKNLISLKLKIMDRMIEKLPDSSKRTLKDMEKTFLSAMHEATKEYTEKENKEKENKGVSPITIE